MKNSDEARHIVIVGAGIIGSSIAFHLTSRGANVTLLDAAEPGQGASAVSFAWLNSGFKRPRHYHDLNHRSMDMWDRLIRRLGGDVGITWGGELNWAATEEGAAQLTERAKILQSWGYPSRLLTEAEFKQIEPDLATGPIYAASLNEIDGHVETGTLIQRAIARSVEQGLRLKTKTRLTGVQLKSVEDGRQVTESIQTDAGQILCDVLVFAGGPDSPELASLVGINLPLSHTFGCNIVTEPIDRIFRQSSSVHTPSDLEMQIGLRQWPNGSVMVHGGLSNGHESYGRTDEAIQEIMKTAISFVPALEGVPVKEVRRGRRPIPEDGLPILGFTEAIPNLYLATMHSGVTLAAIVGLFSMIEILDQTRVDILEPYRLERFADQPTI
ncbi:MAG: FAD-binding oxidoreductase [Chloroflexota bacterium]